MNMERYKINITKEFKQSCYSLRTFLQAIAGVGSCVYSYS